MKCNVNKMPCNLRERAQAKVNFVLTRNNSHYHHQQNTQQQELDH